jgi:hypothetical protein
MATPLLTTKLYIPPVRPELVSRPHLIARLNEGLCPGRVWQDHAADRVGLKLRTSRGLGLSG